MLARSLFLICAFFGAAVASAMCGRELAFPLSFVEFDGKKVPVPRGMAANDFKEEVHRIFISHPEIEMLVVFGSRTHFSYGYLPGKRSDLDILTFGFLPLDVKANLPNWFPWIEEKHGKHVVVDSLNVAMQSRAFAFPESKKQDQELHDEAEERARRAWLFGRNPRGHWEKLVEAQRPLTREDRVALGLVGPFSGFEEPPKLLACGKEALILVRGREDFSLIKAQFLDLDFENVAEISPKER